MKITTLTIGLFMGMCWSIQAYAGDIFKPGVIEWSFSVGYGQNYHTSLLNGNVEEDVKFFPLLVSRSKNFKNLTSRTTLGYAIEGFFSYAEQEGEDRYAIGLTPFLVCNFNTHSKLTPYIELGLGILVTNLDPYRFGGDFGFTPQVGIGIRYTINTDQFLRFSCRYHHISNAGLKDENRSIDSAFFFIGYSFLL